MKARILSLAAAATVLAAPLAAQSATANFNATATVVAALSVQATQDLQFNSVFPGLAESVGPDNADGALIEFGGANNAEVTLDFGTLPTQMTSGGNNMPISFSATDGRYNTVNDRVTGATTFDPSVVQTTNLSGTGSLWVYLGGSVTPGAAQAPGAYTAAISLVATYTGN